MRRNSGHPDSQYFGIVGLSALFRILCVAFVWEAIFS
jgi:hypothetical protein